MILAMQVLFDVCLFVFADSQMETLLDGRNMAAQTSVGLKVGSKTPLSFY